MRLGPKDLYLIQFLGVDKHNSGDHVFICWVTMRINKLKTCFSCFRTILMNFLHKFIYSCTVKFLSGPTCWRLVKRMCQTPPADDKGHRRVSLILQRPHFRERLFSISFSRCERLRSARRRAPVAEERPGQGRKRTKCAT